MVFQLFNPNFNVLPTFTGNSQKNEMEMNEVDIEDISTAILASFLPNQLCSLALSSKNVQNGSEYRAFPIVL